MLRPSPEQEGSRDGEPPRKRVRKGTKSCWECKRRKIRCQLSTEDVAICSGCRARGTTCLSQEFPEEHDPSSGANVGERLGRVEVLLEKIVAKMSRYEEDEQSTQIQTPESMGSIDIMTPFTATITGLFDNDIVSPFYLIIKNMAAHIARLLAEMTIPTKHKPTHHLEDLRVTNQNADYPPNQIDYGRF